MSPGYEPSQPPLFVLMGNFTSSELGCGSEDVKDMTGTVLEDMFERHRGSVGEREKWTVPPTSETHS